MISAIILAYNRCEEVLKTVEHLKQTQGELPYALEIVVVDNGSVDNTSQELQTLHPDIKLIRKEKNNGIAGWNEGFKAAQFDYFLVLDDDSHIHSGLEQAISYMENDRQIGILALEIKDERLEGDPFLDPEKAWKHEDNIVGFIGCGAIIRRAVYEKIGGFAEWIFVYTHEFEYSIRCLNAGFKVVFFGEAIVIHRASRVNRTNKRLRTFATRNELAIVYKFFREHRFKYLIRVFINNLKFMKREGLMSGLYVVQGALNYLKLRKSLQPTPVDLETQKTFADNFWATKPVFDKLKRNR